MVEPSGSLISQESRESHGSGDQFGFDPWTLLNLLDQVIEYNRYQLYLIVRCFLMFSY
jgi:hypothetical protein